MKLNRQDGECYKKLKDVGAPEMGLKVIKALNNNAVLAKKPDGSQIVLMSKGIGFGKRPGDTVDENTAQQKIFYILDSSGSESKLRQLSLEEAKVEQITREIVEIARKKLGIQNEKLFGALLDHITFAIECLQMGLPIDNPFIGEISILYSKEYEIAQIAAEIIKERIGIEIGDGETGFIALHLCSARRNKHIRTTIKNTRVYSEILDMVGAMLGKKLDMAHAPAKSFLLSVHCLVNLTANQNPITMKLSQQVKLSMTDSYAMASKVAEVIEKEMDIRLCGDAVAFIATDIEKLKQLVT